jgi:hypothetical protein
MSRIFISHSSKDRQFADDLAELLRLHYLESWYSRRDILAGPWEPDIYKGSTPAIPFSSSCPTMGFAPKR